VRRTLVLVLPPLGHQRDPGRHQFKSAERKPRELPGIAKLPGQPGAAEGARPGPRLAMVMLVGEVRGNQVAPRRQRLKQCSTLSAVSLSAAKWFFPPR
jgi:hypothetical protein